MITVVTDSSAYLTWEEARALGVRMVSMNYTVAGQLYVEDFSDRNGSFVQLLSLNAGSCSTSQANVSAFLSVFSELTRQGGQVLCVVISSRLSGNYYSAAMAAKEIGQDKVAVIDSLTTAGGLYFLVKQAVHLAKSGAELSQAAFALEAMRAKVGLVFTVDDLNYLRRSGRLGIVRQGTGTILNARPVLLCQEGTVVSQGLARGKSALTRALTHRVPLDAVELVVHQLGAPSIYEQLLEEVRAWLPGVPVRQSPLGPVLGVHLGLGVAAVAWIRK